jgi:putative endopeptidase
MTHSIKHVYFKLFLGFGFLILSYSFWQKTSFASLSTTDPLFSNRDLKIKPGNDFFNYANGGWFRSNPIPPSENSNGIYLMVQDSIDHSLHAICEDCATHPNPIGSIRQRIGDFYASGMDTAARELAGIKPLEKELQRIDQVKDNASLMAECTHLHRLDCSPMFSFYVTRDDKISSKYAVFVAQGGLGLPDRDYYFNTDARTASIRDKYKKHICRMFELSGMGPAESKDASVSVLAVETHLAQACRKMEDLRDPYKNYNKFDLAAFNKLTPSLNWKQLFTDLGVAQTDTVISGQPEFLSALDKTIHETSLSDWKNYYRWLVLNKYGRYLGKQFENTDFSFNVAVMTGSKEQKPRWKRMVELSEAMLNEIMSQEYVAHYLPKNTKEKLTEMGKNIVAVYREHLRNLDWMSETTKAKALHKLDGIVLKMGYPDKWKDYSSLALTRKSFLENIFNITAWDYNFMISKYGKPVDRSEWVMTPETYNAYYEPTNNEIVIPGCNIIVPGFGKGMPDDAVLYGVIGGSTMGHELTHGFDDQGSLYDEQGNLKDWWTKEDRNRFDAKTKVLAAQFSKYVVLDSMHVRGDATLGENIADLGGVIMGYEAFKKTEQWKKQVVINGLTPDQRYFLAYAYSWLLQRRNEALAKQIMSDVHAPAQWRVNGPLSNITAFYTCFDLKPGDVMYRGEKDRVKIW